MNNSTKEAVNVTFDRFLDRKSFYIRTSYRFTPKINIQQLALVPDILDLNDEPISTIALDQNPTTKDYLELHTQHLMRREKRRSFIGKTNNILDIQISSLGNILRGKGQLYFKKGSQLIFPMKSIVPSYRSHCQIRGVYRNSLLH